MDSIRNILRKYKSIHNKYNWQYIHQMMDIALQREMQGDDRSLKQTALTLGAVEFIRVVPAVIGSITDPFGVNTVGGVDTVDQY